MQFSTIMREACTGLSPPPVSMSRLRLFAWMHLLLIFPWIMGPTALAYSRAIKTAWAPETAFVLWKVWSLMTALSLVAAVGILVFSRSRRPIAIACGFAVPVLILASNQISMLNLGVFTSWGTVHVIAMIAGCRVFLGYRLSLFVAISAMVLIVGSAVLEGWGLVPLAPMAMEPIRHPVYMLPGIRFVMIASGLGGLLLSFFIVNWGMNQTLKLHRYITESVLRRYLPPALVRRAASGKLRMDEPPQRRLVTVMFTDLVGFTVMSEKMGAEAIGELLNRYLGEMADLAHEHGATIDKFIGDAVMLVFGAPEEMAPEEQVQKCVRLAQAMVRRAEGLDERLQLRAGIHTGEAVVGNFGSVNRSDWTVIGPTVNIAARLESASQPGKILVSQASVELLQGWVLEDAGLLTLKGVQGKVHGFFVHPNLDESMGPAPSTA
ncbi:MAG: adenylate/guanylate cyclase domain-containing protein [Proteobacteria bacterium]|nr:adenylate/guanylate cyclase domain-containing protein [Pseudomonadota bacterium]